MSITPALPKRLTVSLLTGAVVERDAISNIVRQQADALARFGRAHGTAVDVRVYALSTAVLDSRIAVAVGVADVVEDDHFLRSDLIVYHFGIHYALFDSIHLAPRAARVVTYYHGITPPHLVPPQKQEVLTESYRQAVNLHSADRILVTSRYLTDELLRMGIPAEKVCRVPPSASFRQADKPATEKPAGGPPRLVYVGRFVPAKGVLDLLRGFQAFTAAGGGPIKLDLIGSRVYSDPEYIQRLVWYVVENGLGGSVRFHFDVPDRALEEALAAADALIIPSYHEGFCVPVVEALGCGCFVITSDAGALPETAGGLGRTFPVAAPGAIRDRLAEFVSARGRGGFATDTGFLPAAEWHARAAEYAAAFTPARSAERFCVAVLDGLRPLARDARREAAFAHRRALELARAVQPQAPQLPAYAARLAQALAVAPTDHELPAAHVPASLAQSSNPLTNGTRADKGATYRSVVRRVRQAVTALPDGSVVAVVSKGDQELVSFAGRTGWHFPRQEDGLYAGHYPANSATAIVQVEALRGQGAHYLVFPAPSRWWLDHYAGLRQYLEAHHPVVLEDDVCTIYQLAEPASPHHPRECLNGAALHNRVGGAVAPRKERV